MTTGKEEEKVEKVKEEPKMSAAQMTANKKMQEKMIESQRREYVKGLKTGLEMKELQIADLELSLRYIKAKMQLNELQPEIDKIERQEKEDEEEMKEKIRKAREEAEVEKGPKIIAPKHGVPRKKD